MRERIYCYAPVADAECRVLILGTMPSVESLRQGFYYAHPRNAFWRIVADTIGAELPVTIEAKKRLLLSHHLALWDVLASCEREGSLDSAILAPQPNDIPALLKACPRIERVCLNGGTAARLFERYQGGALAGLERLRLPSTSPAYTLAYAKKLAAWRAAIGGDPQC